MISSPWRCRMARCCRSMSSPVPKGAPALLFGHANGLAAGSYEPWLRLLARRLWIFAFDARGHGGSRWPEGALEEVFADDRMAEDLLPLTRAVAARAGRAARLCRPLARRRGGAAPLGAGPCAGLEHVHRHRAADLSRARLPLLCLWPTRIHGHLLRGTARRRPRLVIAGGAVRAAQDGAACSGTPIERC